MDAFSSFAEAFHCLGYLCSENKTVLVIDELPFLTETEPAVPSIIQRFIDRDLSRTESMLVLCGSSISMMHKETSDQERPLYGRVGHFMEVKPLDLRESVQFHTNMSDADAVKTYMTVGGTPLYHRYMCQRTYSEGIRRCYLDLDAVMKETAESTVRSEFSPFGVHSGILSCIANGTVKQSEIASKLGIERSVCKRYIDDMLALNIVSIRIPMLGSPKQPSYMIKDGDVAFYYSVLRRRQVVISNITLDSSKKYKLLEKDIASHLGRRFEEVCREYILNEYAVEKIGSWWGKVGDSDTDIDVVATVLDEKMLKHTIFAECKFRSHPMGESGLDNLKIKVSALKGYLNGHLMLFSSAGFTESLEEIADDEGIALIGLDHILGKRPAPNLDSMGLFYP